MGNIEENRRHIVDLLNQDNYAVEELEELVLASKYCERSGGGIICFLVEAVPPFESLRAWGSSKVAQTDPDIGRILTELNKKLLF